MTRLKFTSLSALVAVVTVALAIGLVSLGTAQASPSGATPTATPTPTPNYTVPAQVTIGGAGAELKIECKWELPDMSPNTTAMSYEDPYDDTPSQDAGGNACDPVTQPTAAPLRHHMMGILPNAEDLPITRQYEKWVAIESASIGDIIDVYWKVWEPYVADPPNGPNCANPVAFSSDTGTESKLYCFKYQHHATADLAPPTTSNPLLVISQPAGNCGLLENPPLSDMFTAAVETGQMTDAEVAKIIDKCWQREKAIFRVKEEISKDQPSGEYRVEVTAVNSGGQTFTNVNFFDVLGFVKLQLDFSTVLWGTIGPNSEAWRSGDLNFGTADAPTVKNTGNDPMYVEVHYNPLLIQPNLDKQITRFDVALRADWQPSANITTVPTIVASQWYCFDQQPIGSDDLGKLDLSVHPENAQAGTYKGSVDVTALGSCTGHMGIHTH